MAYRKPTNIARHELIVKKSRFIAVTGCATNKLELKSFIENVAKEHPDARHICHASVIGPPGSGICSSNDDGEPSGTAGKPILNVLQHSDIGDIATAVVRYFGGIKLGAGGLVRAYSGCAAASLQSLQTQVIKDLAKLHFSVDFAFENDVRHLLSEADAQEIDCIYSNTLNISCNLPTDNIKSAQQKLNNLTRGTIVFNNES